jgi:hypothetical protein
MNVFQDRVVALERIFPTNTPLRAKMLALIERLAGGGSFMDSLSSAGLHFAEVAPFVASDPKFREIIADARTLGAFVRDLRSEDEAFRRGVEGYDETVIDNRGNAHTVRKFSDRALDKCLSQTRFAGTRNDGLPVLTLNIGREFGGYRVEATAAEQNPPVQGLRDVSGGGGSLEQGVGPVVVATVDVAPVSGQTSSRESEQVDP